MIETKIWMRRITNWVSIHELDQYSLMKHMDGAAATELRVSLGSPLLVTNTN